LYILQVPVNRFVPGHVLVWAEVAVTMDLSSRWCKTRCSCGAASTVVWNEHETYLEMIEESWACARSLVAQSL
jgi:hypothetical protein